MEWDFLEKEDDSTRLPVLGEKFMRLYYCWATLGNCSRKS